MEAVAADVIIFVVLGGDGVPVSLGGHGHVEGGIKHGNLGGVGHHRLAGTNAHQVGRIVEGSQRNAVLNGLDALIVDDAGVGELHAAMEHPMANGIDLIHGLDNALNGVHQDLQDRLNGLGMGGHGDVLDDLLIAHLVGQAAVNVDPLAQALGGHITGLRVHKLILQGRASGIDNQNVHGNSLLNKFCFLFRHCVV